MRSTSPIRPSIRSDAPVETLKANGRTVAYLLRGDAWPRGLNFVTPPETFVQVGSWWYPAGTVLAAHRHKHNPRMATRTHEAVFVRRGRLKVWLYAEATAPFCDVTLAPGDLLVMTDAGHRYEVLADDTQVLEVKNGPFLGVAADKEPL